MPDGWNEANRCQKDIDAYWTKKNGVSHFGYKKHVRIDVVGKLVRNCGVADAVAHERQIFEELLDEETRSRLSPEEVETVS